MNGETRTPERIREHYEIEKELAARLRGASKEERGALYAAVYDELFRRVPDHPQQRTKASPEETRRRVAYQMDFLGRFLGKETNFLEVGPGDCALALEVARHVGRVWAVDVSREITSREGTPANFELVLSDGRSIPVPPGSVDLVYSNQLMEHLHPDDALEQLQNIHAALAPGGRYVCITPNRLNGPHDVSRFFDREATGFHLREYTISELARLFRSAGFGPVEAYFGSRGHYLRLPIGLVRAYEACLERLPDSSRRAVAGRLPVRPFLWPRIVGIKRAATG